MNAKRTSRRPPGRRIFRLRNVVLVLLVLAAVMYLVSPRRIHEIISVDGAHRWQEDAAPPRYKIVWQPAEPVETPAAGLGADDSLIRPQLAEDGTALYFTLRKSDGHANIYRSRLVDSVWQPARPVTELNTEADEVGPAIRPDGRRLYLYSDRPGGYGGFDLYFSDRTPDGWSTPRNLGPRINSPAHEYDPAVSADGLRLFFSSNRTPQMARRADEADEDQLDDRWSTTLRADLGLTNFDLYMARRETAEAKWAAARPLAELNRPDANEGAPHIAPSGAFLFFVSDRKIREEEPNFDIYRARIHGDRVADVENLGSGVNTSANEIEPALSPEGFRLLFSRNETAKQGQPAQEEQYALYCSQATEVFEEVGWGQSLLGALLAALARNWWWVVLFLLTLALLAALIWYVREVSLRRLPVPGFLLIALAIHVLLGIGSFWVYFGEGILRHIQTEFQQIVATRMSAENLHQSHEAGREAYEKVADLKSIETIDPSNVVRQVTEMPKVPAPTDSPIPEFPAKLRRDLPPDRLIAAPPEIEMETESPELQRRRALERLAAEEIEIEQTEAAQQNKQRLERMQVEIDRRQTTEVANMPQTLRRRTLDPAMEIQREEVSAERVVEEPVQTDTDQQPDLQRTAIAMTEPVTAEQVQTEELGAPVAVADTTQPEQESVQVDRQRPTPALASLPTLRRSAVAVASMQPMREEMVAQRISGEPIRTADTAQQPTMLARAARAVSEPAAAEQVETESLAAPEAGPIARQQPQAVGVTIGRQDNAEAPVPRSTTLALAVADRRIGLPGADRPTRREVDPDSTAGPISGKVAARLTRATRTADAEMETIVTEQADAAPAAAASRPSIAGIDVGIDRPEAERFRVPVKTASQFGGRYTPRERSLVIGSLEKEAIDAPPSFSRLASRITRRPARAPLLMYAEDNIGLQAMFRLRQGESKADLVQAFGGNKETLAAVRRGLQWLKKHQHADGYWSLDKFYNEDKGKGISDRGNVKSDTAATGFGLLPFLGDGHTHLSGDYQSSVRKALEWLVEHQKKDGELNTSIGSNTRMYAHAIATIALCEAYGMSKDPELRGPAQRAIDFIVKAQHKPSGGWRYNPNQDADTSVVGWQVMAMKSGQMAALDVSQDSLNLVPKWLNSVEGEGKERGRFRYQRGGKATPAMTAEGLLCLQYLGVDRNDARLQSGARYLLENLPRDGKDNSYYWYYGTQVMYHMQGEFWQQWNNAMRDMLVETQHKDGHLSGTWDSKDEWERKGGRIYSTSLRLLMLEVYYRHLPLYQLVEESKD